jgi:hypothetical protein
VIVGFCPSGTQNTRMNPVTGVKSFSSMRDWTLWLVPIQNSWFVPSNGPNGMCVYHLFTWRWKQTEFAKRCGPWRPLEPLERPVLPDCLSCLTNLLWNKKAHCGIHRSPLMYCILGYVNPTRFITGQWTTEMNLNSINKFSSYLTANITNPLWRPTG